MIEWILPLEIVSPNVQQHWTKKHARNIRNQRHIKIAWRKEDTKPTAPCIVTLDRLYTGRMKAMDEKDNLRMAFKNISDVIADLLVPGLAAGQADDPKHGIQWSYQQTYCNRKGARITIQCDSDAARQELIEQAQELNMGY